MERLLLCVKSFTWIGKGGITTNIHLVSIYSYLCVCMLLYIELISEGIRFSAHSCRIASFHDKIPVNITTLIL